MSFYRELQVQQGWTDAKVLKLLTAFIEEDDLEDDALDYLEDVADEEGAEKEIAEMDEGYDDDELDSEDVKEEE